MTSDGIDDDATVVYVMNGSKKFVSEKVVEEMFEDPAKVVHYEKVALTFYWARPVAQGITVNDSMPPLVLETRFAYAAAARAVATHPEMDAMAALNAASLFSRAVNWETANNNNYDSDEGGEFERNILEEDYNGSIFGVQQLLFGRFCV